MPADKSKKKPKQTKPNFEKDLEQLEHIVESLEEGGLSLEDSIKKFELGITLSKRCEKALTAAEQRIDVLTKNAEGELQAEPFEGETEDGEEDEDEEAGDEDEDEDEDDEEEDEDGEGMLF